MNAYQRGKLKASLVFLRYMQALLGEMVAFSLTHRRTTYTVCVKELSERLCEAELLWIRRHTKTNDPAKKTEYEIVPLPILLTELISQLEEELRLLGGPNAA